MRKVVDGATSLHSNMDSTSATAGEVTGTAAADVISAESGGDTYSLKVDGGDRI
ncbi:MAG: hypothetical protein ACOX2A_03705 [Tepidanaerobacteraceae bacterium]